MFRWHIYHHHQGERVHTKSWNAAGKVKSFLLCTCYQSHSIEIHAHRVWWVLYTCCEIFLHSVYAAPAMLNGHEFLWSDSSNVYIVRRTLLYQHCSSFRWELSLPDDCGVYATKTYQSESDPLKTFCHVKLVHYSWYTLVNKDVMSSTFFNNNKV
jgi:hypothetical protein